MTTFADVLPVEQVGSHKYTVTLKDEWCIGAGERVRRSGVLVHIR